MDTLTSKMKKLEKEIEKFDKYLAVWQLRYYQKLEKLTEANKRICKLEEENINLKKQIEVLKK